VKQLNKLNLQKTYQLQKRVFKDQAWYNAWFRGMKDEWSEWSTITSCEKDKLSNLAKAEERLNLQKVHLKYKVEYRIIKNVKK
jgi:hypothetical protein